MILCDTVRVTDEELAKRFGKLFLHLYSDEGVYIYDHANVDVRGDELLECEATLPADVANNYVESSVHIPESLVKDIAHRYDFIEAWNKGSVEKDLFGGSYEEQVTELLKNIYQNKKE